MMSTSDSRLPGGGGNVVSDLHNLKPTSFGRPVANFITFADNFGDQYENWNGVHVTARARLENGLVLQGGISTGKTTTDNCEVRAAVPEITIVGGVNPTNPYCHVETPFLTQGKATAIHRIPPADVLIVQKWSACAKVRELRVEPRSTCTSWSSR